MAVAGATVGMVVGVKLFLAALAGQHVYTFSTPLPVVLLGTIIGLTYGLLAVGLVLIYRSNRIINFAHGQIGAFGAAVFGLAVVKYGEFNDPNMGHRIGYAAEGKINRKDFGMRFDMMLDGKFIVSNEVQINIEGELVEVVDSEKSEERAGASTS